MVAARAWIHVAINPSSLRHLSMSDPARRAAELEHAVALDTGAAEAPDNGGEGTQMRYVSLWYLAACNRSVRNVPGTRSGLLCSERSCYLVSPAQEPKSIKQRFARAARP